MVRRFQGSGVSVQLWEPKSNSDTSFLLCNGGEGQLLKGSIYVLERCAKV